jgi:acetyltransferase-like isoleucine patch superfamily enzyme
MSTNESKNVRLGAETQVQSSARLCNVVVGDKTKIKENAIIFGSENEPVTIGHECWIGPFCYFNGFWGLTIGNYVDIATGVSIHTDSGPIASSKLARIYPVVKGAVKIEDDVWLGPYVVILPGVIVGSGVVILPHTVVIKNVPAGVVYGGWPPKVIKKIF